MAYSAHARNGSTARCSGGRRHSERMSSAESPPSPASSSNGTAKRLACDGCRDRKIRCDRGQPACGRCSRIGLPCRYSHRSKPSPSRLDLSKILVTLNNRLKQAEAQLATQSVATEDHQTSVVSGTRASIEAHAGAAPNPSVAGGWMSTGSSGLSSPGQTLPLRGLNHHWAGGPMDSGVEMTAMDDWPMDAEACDFDMANFATQFLGGEPPRAPSVADENQGIDFNLLCLGLLEGSSEGSLFEAPTGQTQVFHTRYFDVFHPWIPMVNRTRFEAALETFPMSGDTQALKFAILALGALSVPGAGESSRYYYEQARSTLDVCERQESGESLASVNMLQACTLVTLYELKQPNFARCWMTLGRAIRLCMMIGLHQPKTAMSAHWGLLATSPAAPLTEDDIEERRRTFWILYIFDAFASLRTSARPAFEGELRVRLPTSDNMPKAVSTSTNSPMPTLPDLFGADAPPLASRPSPFTGNIIMIYLYRQYLDHCRAYSPQAGPHAFWETHYRIDKAIRYCRTDLLADHLRGDEALEPLSVAFRMNLDTVEMSLHELALRKALKDGLPEAVIADAVSKCVGATHDMAEAALLTRRLGGTDRDAFRQLDRFLIWPIKTAVEMCLRMLGGGADEDTFGRAASPEHALAFLEPLRVFASLVGELLDPESLPPGLIDNAYTRVAEAAGEEPGARQNPSPF